MDNQGEFLLKIMLKLCLRVCRLGRIPLKNAISFGHPEAPTHDSYYFHKERNIDLISEDVRGVFLWIVVQI